jgi:hypothetical protein
MYKGGKYGNSTRTGLAFEAKTGLAEALESIEGISIERTSGKVFLGGQEVGQMLGKHDLYRYLNKRGVQWQKHLSKRLIPDDAILVYDSAVLTILEKKYQQVAGSVDEKLQTCAFKLQQYKRLVEELGVEVQYTYVLNDWFLKPEYKDVLNYVRESGCNYYFNEVPIEHFGLGLEKSDDG